MVQQPEACGGTGALQLPMAMVHAGEQPPAAVEPPAAGFCGGLLVLGGPGSHVLGSMQPGIATESAVDVGGVLGAT